MITQDKLKELLQYDPLTGILIWRARRSGVRFEHQAGWSQNGYIVVRVFDGQYRAHRLAWLWMTGMWPTNQIDHKNGNRSDNRWDNLREATREINGQNIRVAKSHNKSTGVLGVTAHGSRFSAKIAIGKRQIYLGRFDTSEAAHAAYVEAKRRLHPGCTI